jgi:CDP-6-deoxy-D-xylo-4-hexulose-3-dehydrase
MDIPLALEGLSADEIEIVCEVFRSGNLTMGERVRSFEAEFAARFHVKHAIMVNSGSSAIILALDAFVSTLSKEQYFNRANYFIAIPAVLWPTSLWPIVQLGFKAIMIDTLPNSLEIDIAALIRAKQELGDLLIGAVLIHPLGKSLDLDEIRNLKEEYKLFILEDNCESLGAGMGSQYAGTVGDFGTFSFYYSHHITTVEGGMVVTNSDSYADNLRSMRAHGWTRNRTDKSAIEDKFPHLPNDFLFVTSGYNFRPMEFQGALGSSQLVQLEVFVEKRIRNARKIFQAIQNTNLELIAGNSVNTDYEPVAKEKFGPRPHSWMALPIHCRLGSEISRAVQMALRSGGISTRPLLAGDFSAQPAGNHPMIEKYGELTNARNLYATSFMIGNHHNYSSVQMDYLAATLVNIDQSLRIA